MQRNASSLLFLLSVVGCNLTSPLDDIEPNHPGDPLGNTGGSGNAGMGNNAGTANNAGNNTGGNVTASCPVCNIDAFDCTVDTSTGQASIIEPSEDGCTGTIGDGSSSDPLWLKCDTDQVCVEQEGTCYDATFTADSFTYQITGGSTVTCTEVTSAMPNCDEVELLVDGGFDDGSGAWIEVSSGGFPLIQDAAGLGSVTPHSGSYAAWLGGAPLEDSGLGQPVLVPEGTVSLTASGFFGLTSTDPGLADYAYATIGSDDSGIAQTFAMWDPRDATTPWVPFTSTTDAADLAGLSLTFLIGSTTDDVENTNFFFDSLSLTATVCQ
jgi:hypothetical protein